MIVLIPYIDLLNLFWIMSIFVEYGTFKGKYDTSFFFTHFSLEIPQRVTGTVQTDQMQQNLASDQGLSPLFAKKLSHFSYGISNNLTLLIYRGSLFSLKWVKK